MKPHHPGYWSGRGPSNAARSSYADTDGPSLTLEFDGSDADDGTSGYGSNNGGEFWFDAVFQLRNNGPTELQTGIDTSDMENLGYIEEVETHVHSTSADLDDSVDFSSDPPLIQNNRPNARLDTGESMMIDFYIKTPASNASGADTAEVLIGGVDVES